MNSEVETAREGDENTTEEITTNEHEENRENIENMVEKAWKACEACNEESTEMDVFPPLPSSPDDGEEGCSTGTAQDGEEEIELTIPGATAEDSGQTDFFKSLFELDLN